MPTPHQLVPILPGDVILLVPPHDQPYVVSRGIAFFTRSKYSHVVLALGDGRYADANPCDDEASDICRFDQAELDRALHDRSASLYRWVGGPFDPDALSAQVDRHLAEAVGPTRRIRFSDGALVTLWLLRSLARLPLGLRRRLRTDRLRDAALWVTEEQGDARLLCSEFIYRVLRGVGREPAAGPEPVVSVANFPLVARLDRSPAPAQVDAVDSWLLYRMGLPAGRVITITENLRALAQAWRLRRTPTGIDPANYWTPQDFALSPSFALVADTQPGGTMWTRRGDS